jgi:hypothetical protein
MLEAYPHLLRQAAHDRIAYFIFAFGIEINFVQSSPGGKNIQSHLAVEPC